MKSTIGIIFFLSLVSLQCRKPFGAESVLTIWLKNDSTVYLQNLNSTVYPDTAIPDNLNRLRGLFVNQESFIDFHERNWEIVFDKLPADTLSLFIFSADTIQHYDWQNVRKNYRILKRYDVSLEDLKRLSFHLTYPPSPDMEMIKQWPPY